MAGEPASEPQVKNFKCPSCDAPQSVRGMGQTNTYACSSCGSIIDISNPEYHILQKAIQNAPTPPIALGTRGVFNGTKYEVIGYMVRCDSSGQYSWEEFLLFNPYKGFAWLMDFNGHWNFILSIKDVPAMLDNHTLVHQETRYKLFIDDTARVCEVVGEFYWQVQVGDVVKVRDYIAPPFVLSLESDAMERVWSLGEYMSAADVQQAFNFKNPLPTAEGVGANQPFPGQAYFRPIISLGILFLIGLFFLQIVSSSAARNTLVFSQPHSFGGPSNFLNSPEAPLIKTGVFEVTDTTSNLEVAVSAPVDNNWIYFDTNLVNALTDDEEEGEVEVSYYHGYDDGNWSEGGQSASLLFPAVEPGRYYLTLEPQSGTPQNSIPFELQVHRDVPYWGNYLLASALVLLFPLILTIRRFSFESKRWAESSFAEDDDE